jgi:superfamily I DNA/RNA helicase
LASTSVGRSRTLRVNYRTSHQIRTQADRLLGPVVTDVDGNSEDRSDTISVFNGSPPEIRLLKSAGEEIQTVGNWIAERAAAGVLPHEFGVFVRSGMQLDRARAAVEAAGVPFKILDEHVETTSGHLSISTMHLAKGLEFRAVVVMACDDEIIPLQERIEAPTSPKTLATDALSSTSSGRTVTGSFALVATCSRSEAPGFRMVATTSCPARARISAVW